LHHTGLGIGVVGGSEHGDEDLRLADFTAGFVHHRCRLAGIIDKDLVARRVVLATGAIERPIVFANNDLPGVMLASAVRTYQLQFAVKCGRRAVVFTNNDSAYECVSALMGGSVPISAVVDARPEGPGSAAREIVESAGVELLCGWAVVNAMGKKQLTGVELMALADGGARVSGQARHIDCDLLCVSGGWNPTVHLFSQSQGKLRYDEGIASFVPDESRQAERSAGAKGTAEIMTIACAVGPSSVSETSIVASQPAGVIACSL